MNTNLMTSELQKKFDSFTSKKSSDIKLNGDHKPAVSVVSTNGEVTGKDNGVVVNNSNTLRRGLKAARFKLAREDSFIGKDKPEKCFLCDKDGGIKVGADGKYHR